MMINKETTTTTKKNTTYNITQEREEEYKRYGSSTTWMIHTRTKSRARRRVGHDGNAAKTSPGTTRSPTLFG